MLIRITWTSKNAATKDPVVSRSQTERDGQSTAPMMNATDRERPLPAPRMRVG